MWRRVASLRPSSLLQTLVSPSPWPSSAPRLGRSLTARQSASTSSSPAPFRTTSAVFSPQADSASAYNLKRTVLDIMPIATGHESEELAAELEGRNILEMNYPVGPFGTKEAPAIVNSVYDKRIVGCPGGEGEDEHDVVWFWLEKGKPHECPVCSQYFMLEVVGLGGPPDGHGADDHH